mgnify:CR=1 FL=1
MPGELAKDSKALKRVKVVPCKRGKEQGKEPVPYLGRSACCFLNEQKSAEAVVVDGVTTIQGSW